MIYSTDGSFQVKGNTSSRSVCGLRFGSAFIYGPLWWTTVYRLAMTIKAYAAMHVDIRSPKCICVFSSVSQCLSCLTAKSNNAFNLQACFCIVTLCTTLHFKLSIMGYGPLVDCNYQQSGKEGQRVMGYSYIPSFTIIYKETRLVCLQRRFFTLTS